MTSRKNTIRFHGHRGTNIVFTEDKQVAHRKTSFAHAITFSSRPLRPMEIFLVEIEKNESGWSGHMRIGLTMHNPNDYFQLPQYALPDLANQGRTWVYAVTKSHNKVVDTEVGEITLTHSLLGTGDSVRTFNGIIERNLLRPAPRIVMMKRHKKKMQAQQQQQAAMQSTIIYPPDRRDEPQGAVGGVGISDIPKSEPRPRISAAEAFRPPSQPAPSYVAPSRSTYTSMPSTSRSVVDSSRVERKTEAERRYERYSRNELAGYSAYGGPETRVVLERPTPAPPSSHDHPTLEPSERPGREVPSENVGRESPEIYDTTAELVVDAQMLPTDEGSRIGIVYVIKGNKAEMHFIINGEDQGPCTRDIPYQEGPLFALVDVYGTTKQVRLIQLGGVGTLSNSCREVILDCLKSPGDVDNLKLPSKLKEYLRYERAN